MYLTQTQKEILQKLVELVDSGKLERDEILFCRANVPQIDVFELVRDVGDIPIYAKRTDLDDLKENGYLKIREEGQSMYKCVLINKSDTNTDPDRSTPSNPPQANSSIKKIKIFLASSSELKDDRDQFEIFIRRKNDELIDRLIYLEPVRWENFIDAMSAEGLQEEYNKVVAESDIFVSLFYTKVGRYTEEEFSRAFGTFQENNKPLVYTYFQEKPTNPSLIEPSLHKFKEKLKELKHYPTYYHDINDLKHQFGDQLVKILPKILSLKA